jgi:GntR family transcriptional regulator
VWRRGGVPVAYRLRRDARVLESLPVRRNTVLRSLRLLQDEGLLELRRRRGITVAGTPERGAVMQKVRELVEFARGQGYAVDELVEMIEDVA